MLSFQLATVLAALLRALAYSFSLPHLSQLDFQTMPAYLPCPHASQNAMPTPSLMASRHTTACFFCHAYLSCTAQPHTISCFRVSMLFLCRYSFTPQESKPFFFFSESLIFFSETFMYSCRPHMYRTHCHLRAVRNVSFSLAEGTETELPIPSSRSCMVVWSALSLQAAPTLFACRGHSVFNASFPPPPLIHRHAFASFLPRFPLSRRMAREDIEGNAISPSTEPQYAYASCTNTDSHTRHPAQREQARRDRTPIHKQHGES